MESVRTRSRGKQQQQQQQQQQQKRVQQQEGSWRCTTDETDLDEEDEERLVPVVSGENKRKRAPRSGSSARRVKLKTLTQYEGGSDREGEVSGSTEDTGNVEQGDGASGKETDAQVVERRRESSRVKIKTLKVRENAEAKADVRPTRVKEKKDGKDVVQKRVEDEKPAEAPQRPLKVHLTVSETAKPKTPANTNAVIVQQKPKVGVSPSTNVAPALSPQTPNNAVHSSSTAPSGQKASDLETHDTISSPDQEELETALKVIKKLMKMDAAQPFNKPVDPIAQGVPDYLEIIDTPMDFGTICENLEKRQKYKNALDVYRDIQQIWTNCRKYNHKGDPILELMKKVQKACSKYWTANGVLRDPKKSKKGEAHAMEQPSEIFIAKATSHHPEDTNKLRPGAGTSSHKGTCGCVVCVAVRRKAARERRAVGLGSARAVKRQIAKMKGKQDLSDLDMEELMQLDETFLDQEEADHFYPANYQIPLRPVHPLVLSLGQALFRCRPEVKKQIASANPFVPIVSAYESCKQS